MKNKSIIFIILTTILICSISCKGETEKNAEGKTPEPKKPNIVLLFVDDYGWADVGYRNPLFHTPNIDQLKTESLDFSRAYITTPTCSPSRASILTGKESIRLGMPRHIIDGGEALADDGTVKEYNLWPKDPVQMPSRNWLPLEEITYAERLKEFGYYNIFIGKWHLGHEPFHPTKQGFDDYYGNPEAGHPKSYYFPFFKQKEIMPDFSKEDYLTDVLTTKTEDFIKTYDKDQPFMLSLWYYNVHGPHVGRKDWVEKYKKEGLEGKYLQYAAMISAMDESVGRVREALKEKGIEDNTVFIFTSDQGGYFTNAPLSGGKIGGNTLGEGGARVPFMINYPGVTKAGTDTSTPIQTLDLYPTLVEIASGKLCTDSQINGKSLMPLLKGEKTEARNLYFFRSYEDQYAAVMNGEWKLIKYHSGKFELFNVVDDISEKNNRIGEHLEIEDQLKADIAKWEQEAVPTYN
jgi:arylsulfatase A-like enzyme